jgi:hypothetical protein
MASGWCTVPSVTTAAQVVQTPEQQELGNGTPAASAAANTVCSLLHWKVWLLPSMSQTTVKAWESVTGKGQQRAVQAHSPRQP